MSTQADRVQVLNTAEVLALNGRSLGPTPWFTVHQERVDAFARAVADWHWAHNDVERAARGPFGGTIGHAHLTLSLVPHLFASLLGFAAGEDAMFYGYNRVRFPYPFPSGQTSVCAPTSWTQTTLAAASSSPWTCLSSSTGQTGRRVLPRHCSATITSRHQTDGTASWPGLCPTQLADHPTSPDSPVNPPRCSVAALSMPIRPGLARSSFVRIHSCEHTRVSGGMDVAGAPRSRDRTYHQGGRRFDFRWLCARHRA